MVAVNDEEFVFDWEILGSVQFKTRSGREVNCCFSRVYIDDYNLVEEGDVEYRVANQFAWKLVIESFEEVYEELFPEIVTTIQRRSEKQNNETSFLSSNNNQKGIIEESDEEGEEIKQMIEFGVPASFGKRENKKRKKKAAVRINKDTLLNDKKAEASCQNHSECQEKSVENLLNPTTATDVDIDPEQQQEESCPESGTKEAAAWNQYWSLNGPFIVGKKWLQYWGSRMEDDIRKSTEQSLIDFDQSTLLPIHQSFLMDDHYPLNKEMEKEKEQKEEQLSFNTASSSDSGFASTWDDVWTDHSNYIECLCYDMYTESLRKARQKLASGKKRVKKAKQKLREFGLSFENGQRKLVNYGDLDMFVDAHWELRPKLAEDNDLILFQTNNKPKKVFPKKNLLSDLEATDQLVEGMKQELEVVNFSFDADRDCNLVAKNALKVFGNDRELRKYWSQRFRLFKRINNGILMDREGWFSVTPEYVAEHIAERVVKSKDTLVVDAFAGVGGNSIQFARKGALVISIDLDPVKLKCARRNAEIYGVSNRISFICANFFHVAAGLKADVVFLSPPWGGPGYLQIDVFDLHKDLTPPGFRVFEAARRITSNIAFYVPRNASVQQLASLADPGDSTEIEQSILNSKLKAMTAYYGSLIAG